MRRIASLLLMAVLLAGCSSSAPKFSAVFTPTVPPPTASAPPAGSSPAVAVDTSAWITLAPQGEGFSIIIPGTSTSLSGSGGTYTYTFWTYTDNSGRDFLVEESKFPKGALSGPARSILDYTQSSFLGQYPGAKVEIQSDLTLDGHAARTGVFANSTTRVQGEMVIVGDTIYIFGASYPVGLADDGVVNAFMASFKLAV